MNENRKRRIEALGLKEEDFEPKKHNENEPTAEERLEARILYLELMTGLLDEEV